LDPLERQFGKLEFLLFVLDSLIPEDQDNELPSAAQVLCSNLVIVKELETTFEQFDKDYHKFCEGRDRVNHMDSQLIQDFATLGTSSSSPFLRKVLELYYTDSQVLSKFPEFAGITFPNSRKMPQNNFEILEPVIDRSEKN
jgi:hypothetical protein